MKRPDKNKMPAEWRERFARARRIAEDMGIPKKDLGRLVREHFSTLTESSLAKVIDGKRRTRHYAEILEALAKVFAGAQGRESDRTRIQELKREIFDGIEHKHQSSHAVALTGPNPKPIIVGPVRIESLFLLRGNNIEELHIDVEYSNEPVEIDPAIRPLYDELAKRKRRDAYERNYQYHPDGPCVRLIRAIPNTKQHWSGRERRGIILELGPVSWEEFTVLNEFPDIRTKYADYNSLYANGSDLRWCRLSNLLVLGVMPLTIDGFGLVQQRGPEQSIDQGLFTCGIAENIHRFLDEAPPDDLTHRIHPLTEVTEKNRWEPYRPRGKPSPLLAAQRGIWEELSRVLHNQTLNPERFRFLALAFELVKFLPVLIGVVELDHSREELEPMIRQLTGEDHQEFSGIKYLSLDIENSETATAVADQSRWVPAGLAAFLGATRYWAAKRHEGS